MAEVCVSLADRIDKVETRAEWAQDQMTWDPTVLGTAWVYLWVLSAV